MGRSGPKAPGDRRLFAFLLASFAGLPLTSGFIAKFSVFSAAVGHGGATGTTLVVLGVLCSAITVYAYFKVVRTMYFGQDATDDAAAPGDVVVPSAATTFAIAVGTLVTVVLGVAPSTLLDLAERCSQFVR